MTQNKTPLNILTIEASARSADSVTRRLAADLAAALRARHGDANTVTRDLAEGVSLVDEAWIEANFTAAEERSNLHRDALAESDQLVDELKRADIVIIGSPIYNFGVPAALKAWIDLVARARLTFRYTDKGPVGLLEGKKAYLVIASGGTTVDSDIDFATPYLRQALGFLGITDIEVISADRGNSRGAEALDAARMEIANRIHTAPLHTAGAA